MICSYCRIANWNEINKCRGCKSSLIKYEPLTKHEENFIQTETYREFYVLNRLRPRKTSIDIKLEQEENFPKIWESMWAEFIERFNKW